MIRLSFSKSYKKANRNWEPEWGREKAVNIVIRFYHSHFASLLESTGPYIIFFYLSLILVPGSPLLFKTTSALILGNFYTDINGSSNNLVFRFS